MNQNPRKFSTILLIQLKDVQRLRDFWRENSKVTLFKIFKVLMFCAKIKESKDTLEYNFDIVERLRE